MHTNRKLKNKKIQSFFCYRIEDRSEDERRLYYVFTVVFAYKRTRIQLSWLHEKSARIGVVFVIGDAWCLFCKSILQFYGNQTSNAAERQTKH